MVEMNNLATKLLKLRKHYNYSQEHLANILGIDVLEYMAIENGRDVLNYAGLKKLASLYKIHVDELFINSKEVTLHEVDFSKTEELNLKYFLKDENKTLTFIKKNLIWICLVLIVLCFGILFLVNKENQSIDVNPDEVVLENINRLSVSDTTVVYIDDAGNVKGTGDNSYGQLSNLPTKSAIKVCEGSNYTIVLNNDGSVTSIGLSNGYASDLEKWRNIVDIASGDNHIVGVDTRGNVYAIGDNSSGQCDVNDYDDIEKVFAFKNGTVLLSKEGKLYSTGEFLGQSQIKNYSNILDIDVSNDNLVILTLDKTVEYVAAKKNFLNIYKWRDVVDVACGDEFVAALTSDGKVYIDCDDKSMSNEVDTWENVIAICAADEYLIAYDGTNIMGVGKNDHLQFENNQSELVTLAQVGGVKISCDEVNNNSVSVSFDKVANATGYEITLNIDDENASTTYRVSSNQTITFTSDSLVDGGTYEITITTLGDDINYLSSSPLVVPFTYLKANQDRNVYVDIDFDYTNMSIDELSSYLNSIGVKNVIGVEIGQECEDNSKVILSVNGISSGQRISKEDLSKATVTYEYCRIKNTDNNDSGDNNEQDLEN